DELDVASRSTAEQRPPFGRPGYLNRFQRRKLAVIVATLIAGLGVRVYKLDAAGVAGDAGDKKFSVRSYLRGDFTVNSEHPMLMKVLCLASIESCRAWNDKIGVRVGAIISEETSLRLPNAIFGALTVVPLFLLANALFGFRVASITACLWALG